MQQRNISRVIDVPEVLNVQLNEKGQKNVTFCMRDSFKR